MRVALASAKNRLATGVDRYAREFSVALRAQGVETQEIVLERQEKAIGPLKVGGNLSVWAQRVRTRRGEADLLHALDPAVATKHADVVTVHDLLPEEFPELFLKKAGDKLDWALSRSLSRRARWFVTPSEATRRALITRWGIAPERVLASHHGIDHATFKPTLGGSPHLARGKRTLVYVGDDNPRKHLDLIVEAMARGPIDARLVRVGPSRFPAVHEQYRKRAREAGVELVEPGYMADADLVRLLSGADAFVWPTRGEGFGFPPVEAMACGLPVVALDTPVNREVCGPTARYHPDAVAACAEAIHSVFEKPPAKEAVVAYARTFTWEASAKRVIGLYERALEERR